MGGSDVDKSGWRGKRKEYNCERWCEWKKRLEKRMKAVNLFFLNIMNYNFCCAEIKCVCEGILMPFRSRQRLWLNDEKGRGGNWKECRHFYGITYMNSHDDYLELLLS